MTQPVDTRGRGVTDLRLSVTDRCNLRCTYCMPRELFGANHVFLPRDEILSYEEFARLVTIFAGLGVSKVRLTGGEPLLRRDLETLISAIAATPGISDIAMTTNGALLGCSRRRIARRRTQPGHREPRQRRSGDLRSDGGHQDPPLDRSRRHRRRGGRRASGRSSSTPWSSAASTMTASSSWPGTPATAGTSCASSSTWTSDPRTAGRRRDVVPAAEILARVHAVFPVRPLPPSRPGEVARRWAYEDGAGEIGIISSVSEPFCGDCTRARITSTGELFTCLFAATGHGPARRAAVRCHR